MTISRLAPLLLLLTALRAQAQEAHLYDSTHDPQRYATQGACVSRTEWQPFDTEDLAGLAQRRQQVGLPPMEDYQASMNSLCAKNYSPDSADLQLRKARLSEGVDVAVRKDGIQAAGQTVQTPEQLLALLADQHILKIRLHVDAPEAGYETIGKIIYGTQRATIFIASIETSQP